MYVHIIFFRCYIMHLQFLLDLHIIILMYIHVFKIFDIWYMTSFNCGKYIFCSSATDVRFWRLKYIPAL